MEQNDDWDMLGDDDEGGIEPLLQPKIGYVLIENYQTDKLKVCEAPKHQGWKLTAYAVIALIDERGNEIVQMVCEECWQHFDDDMNHPNWNLQNGQKTNTTS